jgi:catalase (peroxidase I)
MGMGMGMGRRMGGRRMGTGGRMTNVIGSSVNSDVWEDLYDLGTPMRDEQDASSYQQFGSTLQDLDHIALAADIKTAMYNNRYFFPADHGGTDGGIEDAVFSGDGGSHGENGNYGPLFARLAWHCSGTWRMSDGNGGCSGGRQRFEPERSWDDNTNLDKARALLAPIKMKYGDALSWGDLITFAGTTAMRVMGTPISQHCFGRIDDTDGTKSLPLGIGGEPESSTPPCEVQGMCNEPLGAGTVGLIYVNPEGPVLEAGGSPVPDPVASAANIRDVFGRMGQDDRDTVALIGGGHTVGKSHGACNLPAAQGLIPREAYELGQSFAWEGECGQGSGLRGKGPHVVTSGIEGPWTTRPTYWDNEFFTKLVDREWELFTGPGGKHQWRIVDPSPEEAILMRMTTDIALINDDRYRALVEEFAQDLAAFDQAFDVAWFKLVHRGGSWSPNSKCDVGSIPSWVTEAGNNRMLDSDY